MKPLTTDHHYDNSTTTSAWNQPEGLAPGGSGSNAANDGYVHVKTIYIMHLALCHLYIGTQDVQVIGEGERRSTWCGVLSVASSGVWPWRLQHSFALHQPCGWYHMV